MRSLFDAEPAKETKLNDLAHPFVERSQIMQSIVERDQYRAWIAIGNFQVLIERHLLRIASALQVEARARIARERVPHQLRAHGKEMRTVLPIDFPQVEELHVDLVNESGVLQDVIGFFPGHVALRETVQLFVNEGGQMVERLAVSAAPSAQQSGYTAEGGSIAYGYTHVAHEEAAGERYVACKQNFTTQRAMSEKEFPGGHRADGSGFAFSSTEMDKGLRINRKAR